MISAHSDLVQLLCGLWADLVRDEGFEEPCCSMAVAYGCVAEEFFGSFDVFEADGDTLI